MMIEKETLAGQTNSENERKNKNYYNDYNYNFMLLNNYMEDLYLGGLKTIFMKK